jgi:predicted TPR repeat methyltransferase
MVSILLEKLRVCELVVSTDGDDDTVDLLLRNLNACNEPGVIAHKLWWGECDEFCARFPEPFDIVCAADVIYEREQIIPLISTVARIMKSKFVFAHFQMQWPSDMLWLQEMGNFTSHMLVETSHLMPLLPQRKT